MNTSLKPLPGYALVALDKQYQSGLSTEKEKYSTNTSGTLVSVGLIKDFDTAAEKLIAETTLESVGKTVYFASFQDGEPVCDNGFEYVFVPISEIRGVKQ